VIFALYTTSKVSHYACAWINKPRIQHDGLTVVLYAD